MNTKAIYAGTFDPITNGHLDIIERASKLYDTLYIVIFDNVNKHCLFTLEERLDLIKKTTSHLNNVVIDHSDLLAVEYAKKIDCQVLVRGLRATKDFEYELEMALSNQYLDDSVDMVFLMTKPQYQFISSSNIKEIASHNHSVENLVPKIVEEALYKKFK